MQVVYWGKSSLLTDDPIVIALARRCAELEATLQEHRHQEVARYRTLRRDVSQIRRAVLPRRTNPSNQGGSYEGHPAQDPGQ